MAITQAGKKFTSLDLYRTSGDVATMIRNYIQHGMDFKGQLESWPDADLIAMGLTQEEVNAMKGFYIGDLPAFATLLQNSAWIRQLIGTGV